MPLLALVSLLWVTQEQPQLERVAVTPEQYQSFLKGSKIDLQTGEREGIDEDKPKES